MASVFISYRRKDFERLQPLLEALDKEGVDYWLDKRDVEEFEDFRRSGITGNCSGNFHTYDWRKASRCFYGHDKPPRFSKVRDHQRARTLQEHLLERQKELLGVAHPDTTTSAWNLFTECLELNDTAAAATIFSEDLVVSR